MGFAWSRTTYAEWNGIIFNFEQSMDRDYFVHNMTGARKVSAKYAWDTGKDFVRVYASSSLGANEFRKRKIKAWKEGLKRNV